MILKYEDRGGMIAYFTADGEFVYPADHYESLAQVEAEIAKRVSLNSLMAAKSNKVKIIADLKDKKVLEKVKDG